MKIGTNTMLKSALATPISSLFSLLVGGFLVVGGLTACDDPSDLESGPSGERSDSEAVDSGHVDPVWQITVHSAVLAPKTPFGEDWDNTIFQDALPDAYVTGGLLRDQFDNIWSTANVDNTLTPVWDEAMDSYLQSDLIDDLGFRFTVRDSDGLGAQQMMGTCIFFMDVEDLMAGTITLPTCGESVTNLRIDFSSASE